MGRPKKIGLEYFPLDTSFFVNKKIKALRRERGSIGIAVYLNILCRVYGSRYYFEFLDFKELCIDIAEDLVGERDQIRQIASKVAEVLRYMTNQGLIDKNLFEMNVISSQAMQEQYLSCATAAKRKVKLDVYSLLNKSGEEEHVGDRTQKKGVSSEEMRVSSEETGICSEESTQSKSKSKSKSKNISLSIAHEKGIYGKHSNVMLTSDEYAKISAIIPSAYLDLFSEKLHSNGYKYDDHYKTLLEWWESDKDRFGKTSQSKGSSPRCYKPSSATPYESFDTDDFFFAAVRRSYEEGYEK